MLSHNISPKYKHIDPVWAEDFASGKSIQLGTYAYYQGLEGDRYDALEGVSSNALTYVFTQGDELKNIGEHPYLSPFASAGLEIFNGEMIDPVTFKACTYSTIYPDEYLFCCSNAPNLEIGCAVVEISDPVLFAGEIMKAVAPRFIKCDMAQIVYDKQIPSIHEGGPAVFYEPFKKPKNFEWEDEYRIKFIVSEQHTFKEPSIRICCPSAGKYMKVIHLPEA